MDVELNPEDQKRAEAMVASGRFTSISEAIHFGLEALNEDPEWQEYAQDRIEAGWADMEAGRTIPGEEFEEWLRSKLSRSA